MKKNYSILFCAIALLGMVACEDSNDENEAPEITVGAYILNCGKQSTNTASLTYYDAATEKATQDVFLARNNIKLGVTSNDMIIYGSKMYIAVQESGVLFVTDKQGTFIEKITLKDYKEPNRLTSYNGKVYASYFDGGIVQIDTATFATKTAKTGANPVELKASNSKLYVALSEGMNYPNYGTTVAVINPTTLEEINRIEVGLNPNAVAKDNNGNIYVTTIGNYTDIPAELKKIDTETDIVSTIALPAEYGTVVHIAMGADNKLFLIAGANDSDWKFQGKIYTYNTSTQKFEGAFVTDGTTISNMFSLNTDAVNGDVYVGTSDYKNDGDVYIFGTNGKLKTKIEVGLNPMKVVPVRTR